MLARIIRICLTITLIYLSYEETGIFTTICLGLIAARFELDDIN
jgi:hypothetical protein